MSYQDRGLLLKEGYHGSENHHTIGIRHLKTVDVHQRHNLPLGIGKSQESKVAVDLAIEIDYLAGLFGIHFLDCSARGHDIDQLPLFGSVVGNSYLWDLQHSITLSARLPCETPEGRTGLYRITFNFSATVLACK